MRRLVPVALACVLAQLASLAHIAVVRHVRCAEHGEWVHSGESASDDSAVESFAELIEAEDAARWTGTSTADDHDHDHCGAVSEHRSFAPVSAPVAPIRSEHPALATENHRASRGALAHDDVVRFAPKTSPPSAMLALA